MATVTRVQVAGLRELGAAMRGLSVEVNLKLSGQTTAAGARVIKDGTKSNIRSNSSKSGNSIDSGSMLDSVITKKIPKAQTSLTSEHIVTFRGRGKPYNKKGQRIARAPHAHLVEFGTVNMPAEPNMRTAFDSGKEQAAQVMADTLSTGIDRAAKKVGKK